MSIDQKYKDLIHTDCDRAAAPAHRARRTCSSSSAPASGTRRSRSPATRSRSRTRCRTSTSTRSCPRSTPTPASTSTCSSTAPARDFRSNGGNELAQVIERFEPTHRDLARLNGAVAQRGADLRQLVNSLQRLNTALAPKQPQIVQLVDSSEQVFGAFASEDRNVSRAVADLPATLSQTTATLAKVQAFAQQLGPAATNLLPAANALQGRQPGADRARGSERADRAEPDPPVRGRGATGRPQPAPGRGQPGRRPRRTSARCSGCSTTS